MRTPLFEDLFVLELASNHWGKLDRGLKIVNDHGRVVREAGVRAALKLQFRDIDTFVHPQARNAATKRYVDKALATKMPWGNYRFLVEATRQAGMVTMATPFDEASVAKCIDFDVEIIKIASSDIQDWFLVETIAAAGKPTMISTGGASLADMDRIVDYFEKRGVPLGVNHCVSIYPSADSELELNQIDFLARRYPDNVIGLSTHEQTDWRSSVMIAYAKGARTFERHIDVEYEGVPVSPYCSLPHQVADWFAAFLKAKEMCGGAATSRRELPRQEMQYLAALARGAYARRALSAGHVLTAADVYLAIPLNKGQVSSHELRLGEALRQPVRADAAIRFADLGAPEGAGLESWLADPEAKSAEAGRRVA